MEGCRVMFETAKTLAAVPRVKLFEAPTPLERMFRMEEECGGIKLFIKRDDCMSLGMGGNKLRSLEFWMGKALSEKNDIVVVAGAPASNQCRLTAAAAAKLGLDCLILHSSDEPEYIEGNLLLNYLMGATIRFVGPVDEKRRKELALMAAAKLTEQGRSPYLIGDAVVGACGYVSGAFELYEQQQGQNNGVKHVFLAGSMGTTEAGFILGNALLGYPFDVHLISVEYNASELSLRIKKIFGDAAAYLDVTIEKTCLHKVHIYEEYLGDGYNVPTEDSLSAISLAASKEGFFLENTYTSKTFAGMLDLIKKGFIPHTEPTCFLHTGGIPALFAQQHQLQRLIGK